MTITELKTEIQQRAIDHSEAMSNAEANGYEDYDYYEGLVEAYECVLVMLNQLDKETE